MFAGAFYKFEIARMWFVVDITPVTSEEHVSEDLPLLEIPALCAATTCGMVSQKATPEYT